MYWRYCRWLLYSWSLNNVNNVAMMTHVNQGSQMWIKDKTEILANLISFIVYIKVPKELTHGPFTGNHR